MQPTTRIKKIFILFLCTLLIFSSLPIESAQAALPWHKHSFNNYGVCKCGDGGYKKIEDINLVVTTENDVTSRKGASTNSDKVTYYPKGTTVTLTGKYKNSYGNIWYKLSGGTFIFEDNLHFHKAIMCGLPYTIYTKIIGDSRHKSAYYSGDEFCSCGEKVKTGNRINTLYEYHQFDSNLTCTLCGFTHQHDYNNVTYKEVPSSYTRLDINNHTRTDYSGNGYCSCSQIIVSSNATNSYSEPHTFNDSNICIYCGEPKHIHEASMCGLPYTKYEKIIGDSRHKITNYLGDEFCICGEKVKIGSVSNTLYEFHQFDSNLTCTLCGFTHQHDYNNITYKEVPSTYIKVDSNKHTKNDYNPNGYCSCSQIIIPSTLKNSKTELHTYDSFNNCIYCGQSNDYVGNKVNNTKNHEHKLKYYKSLVIYKESNKTTHTLDIYENLRYCECGKCLDEFTKTKTVKEKHNYSVWGYCETYACPQKDPNYNPELVTYEEKKALLDAFSLLPVVGDGADLTNIYLALEKGEYLDAVENAFFLIPFTNFLKVGKHSKNYKGILKAFTKNADSVDNLAKQGIRDSILKSKASKKWGVSKDGINQGIKHFSDFWDTDPKRILSLEERLGVKSGFFSNSLEGFENFTLEAENVIAKAKKSGKLRNVNGKIIYYVDGADTFEKGVVVIVNGKKLQSMMPSNTNSFNKLK